MKIKPQRPRSCLGWFAWVFGILLMLFAISYTIDMARLANAWREADALAARLGYTPERHLKDLVWGQINPVIGTSRCQVEVFFTTPLDPADFASHLAQAVSPLADGSPTDGLNMYVTLYPTGVQARVVSIRRPCVGRCDEVEDVGTEFQPSDGF